MCFLKLWVHQKMEHVIVMPVYTSLWGAQSKIRINTFTNHKIPNLWKVKKSQLQLAVFSVFFSILPTISCVYHQNLRGAFRYSNIKWKTFQYKLIPLKFNLVVAKKLSNIWQLYITKGNLNCLVLIKTKLAKLQLKSASKNL